MSYDYQSSQTRESIRVYWTIAQSTIRSPIESFDDYAISAITILTVAHFGQVVERHPDTLRERLWRTGVEAHSMLYCGGEVTMTCFNDALGIIVNDFQVATIASDAGRVYAAMRHGEVCKKRESFLGKNGTHCN